MLDYLKEEKRLFISSQNSEKILFSPTIHNLSIIGNRMLFQVATIEVAPSGALGKLEANLLKNSIKKNLPENMSNLIEIKLHKANLMTNVEILISF